MALTRSDTLTEFFGVQPDANKAPTGSVADIMHGMNAKIEDVLSQYGAGSAEVATAISRIHDRALHIATLAESAPDTTAGQLHAMRIEVMADRAMDKIRTGLSAREAQHLDYLRSLLGANDNSPVSAPDALAA